MNSTVSGIVLIVLGPLSMISVVLNWTFLSRRKLFNLVLGEKISRIIYFAAGILLFFIGIERLIGANWIKL